LSRDNALLFAVPLETQIVEFDCTWANVPSGCTPFDHHNVGDGTPFPGDLASKVLPNTASTEAIPAISSPVAVRQKYRLFEASLERLAIHRGRRALESCQDETFTLFLLVGIPCGGQTAPSCKYLAPEVKPDDPFQFAMAFVESLSYAKTAFRPPTPDLASADAALQLSDLIFRMKAADLDYNCAAELLSGYQKSKKATTALAATNTVLLFRSLSDKEKESIELLKRYAANPTPDLSEQMADLRLQRANIWEELPLAVIGVTFALASDQQDSKGKLSSLTITSQQRRAIMEALEKTFGPVVKGGLKDGQDNVAATAVTLYTWIADKAWKTSDGK